MVPIDHFDTAADLAPDAIALVDGGTTVTFAELQRQSHALAAAIADAAGDRAVPPVVLFTPNDYRAMTALLGIMRAGGAIVPVHAANPIETTRRFLESVVPAVACFHSALAPIVAELRPHLPSIRRWIAIDEPARAMPAGRFDAAWIDAAGNRDRPVYYWATSGTSGEPKVVIDDVGSFEAAVSLIRAQHSGATAPPVSLVVAPLSHGAGPHSFAVLALGGTVIVPRRFDAQAILAAIETHRVTDLWLPPTALYLLLDCPDIGHRELRSLQQIQLGTAGTAPARLREAIARLGPCIGQTYGQIETGFVTMLDPAIAAAAAAGIHPERLASSGRSLFVNRVAIMDEDGRLLPPGDTGEVVVRGKCVKRYLDQAATAHARRFGWHHTGDLGYLDADGFLFIVGRTRDVVNMAGIKIPASELERVILELPSILECAVVAVADPVRGEVPAAIVSGVGGHRVNTDEVIAHCRRRLGAARAPARVEQWPELPKSPAGKLDKRRISAVVASASTGGLA